MCRENLCHPLPLMLFWFLARHELGRSPPLSGVRPSLFSWSSILQPVFMPLAPHSVKQKPVKPLYFCNLPELEGGVFPGILAC